MQSAHGSLDGIVLRYLGDTSSPAEPQLGQGNTPPPAEGTKWSGEAEADGLQARLEFTDLDLGQAQDLNNTGTKQKISQYLADELRGAKKGHKGVIRLKNPDGKWYRANFTFDPKKAPARQVDVMQFGETLGGRGTRMVEAPESTGSRHAAVSTQSLEGQEEDPATREEREALRGARTEMAHYYRETATFARANQFLGFMGLGGGGGFVSTASGPGGSIGYSGGLGGAGGLPGLLGLGGPALGGRPGFSGMGGATLGGGPGDLMFNVGSPMMTSGGGLGDEIREQNRKISALIQFLLLQILSGNIDAITSAMIAISRKSKGTLILSSVAMLSAMQQYDEQQARLTEQFKNLQFDPNDPKSATAFQHESSSLSMQINSIAVARQMFMNQMRDVMTMSEEIGNIEKSVLDIVGQYKRSYSRFNV